ncbi:MAG: type I restriction enzyme HsdR N-terminal domain-containing protein [Nitrospirae bacterium]|nr:type I restriction enzyme HsdR N-terminal domain-containing protein [Nitrospirota bacterium]
MKDFKMALKKILPKIRDAKERALNEADTRMRIRLLLADVLGYDLLDEITQEHMIQGHYVDFAVKAPMWNKKAGKYTPEIVFLVEAKSVDTNLKDTHAYQVNNYAASAGVSLSLLTNGVDYKLYHLTWDKNKGVENNLIVSFNILDDDTNEVVKKLYLISKESFKKGVIDKFIAETTSLSERNLITAMLSERVLNAIRLELKNITGHSIKNEAVEQSISQLFATELYEAAKDCLKKQARKISKPEIKPIMENTETALIPDTICSDQQ